MELLNRMTNKVGPLPAWAWAAIPATGYVAYSYWRASQGDGYIADVEPDSNDGTGSEDDYGINNGSQLPGYGSAPGGSSNAIPPIDTPKFTNEAWFRQASNWLISEGVTSSDAITALNAYLYGSPSTITSTQMAALQKALRRFGAAPDPAFVPGTTPDTPTPNTSAPAAPTNVSAAASGVNYVTVTWNPVANATVYEVQRSIAGTNRWDVLATTAKTEYKAGSRAPKVTFRVRARNRHGASAWAMSETVSPQVTTPAKPTAPAPNTPNTPSRRHVVVRGDTMWALAQRYYRDGRQWPKIKSANPSANPDSLRIGEVLVIPS